MPQAQQTWLAYRSGAVLSRSFWCNFTTRQSLETLALLMFWLSTARSQSARRCGSSAITALVRASLPTRAPCDWRRWSGDASCAPLVDGSPV